MGREFRYWFPVVAWAVLIFILSSIPNLKSDLPSTWDLIFRKMAHMAEFGVFALLLLRAFIRSEQPMAQDWLFAFVIACLYAVSDEVHQLAVQGRAGSVWDVMIDMVGIVCGLCLYWLWRRSRKIPSETKATKT